VKIVLLELKVAEWGSVCEQMFRELQYKKQKQKYANVKINMKLKIWKQ
jgi:hypothetical protein